MVKQRYTTILISLLLVMTTLYSTFPNDAQNLQLPVIKHSSCQSGLESTRCTQTKSQQCSILRESLMAIKSLVVLLCALSFSYTFIKKLAPREKITRPPRMILQPQCI